MRTYTAKDLRYYYFYYGVGCRDESCSRCGIQQRGQFFDHLFDDAIILRAEKVLRRKVKELRLSHRVHSGQMHGAALHRFDPKTHTIGEVVRAWNREELEGLVPIKRRSNVAWYRVTGIVTWRIRGMGKERFFRLRSFPATSVEGAEQIARRRLKRLEKRLKRNQSLYEACLHYANSKRGIPSLPGTDSNILVRPDAPAKS